MKNKERIRERFLKDPTPIRLAGLAADLSRVSSSTRRANGAGATAAMLEESQYLIEWTAAEVAPEVGEELVNIQLMLSLWRRAWPEAQQNQLQRTILSTQAKHWSDQVMRHVDLDAV